MTARSIECPKCGAVVPAAEECARCGVVFAKAASVRPAPAPAPRLEQVSPVKEKAGRGRLEVYLGLALVVVLGAFAADQWIDARVAEIEWAGVDPVARLPGRLARDLPGAQRDQPPAEAPPETDSEPVSRGFDTAAESARRSRRAPPAEVPEPIPAAPAPAPVVAPTPEVSITPDPRWYEGALGFETGWERAKKTKQPVLVYFYTDWCGYCRQLESKLFDHGEVRDFTQYLVKVRINPERGSNERLVADFYGVRSYPSVFVHRAGPGSSKKVRRMTKQSGEWKLMAPRQFVDVLADAAVGR